ncbi:uncharacterized protein RJT21DRAFT_118901 [Scheffersomyces amazonensis]|uniref:uncharacterized protein n=1 Tax=Scheffersomyces amazonensis TaxID=1078765 RepID=UPI00315D2F9F
MWIVTHEGDQNGEIRFLEPNRTYTLGRFEDVDFLYQSSSVSRHQLELVVGSINEVNLQDAEFRTPLCIKVLSRAKSTVNGTLYKLSKGQNDPIILDVTNDENIEIILASDIDKPLQIKWVDFTIMTFTKNVIQGHDMVENHLIDDLINLYKDGIDIRITMSISKATHYYSIGEPNSNSFKIAVAKGIPILNRDWIENIRHNKQDVQHWLLHIDYEKYLPGGAYLLPNKSRSYLLTNVCVFLIAKEKDKFIHCITALGGKGILLKLDHYYKEDILDLESLAHDMKSLSNDSPCIIMKFSNHESSLADKINNSLKDLAEKFNTNLVTEDTIWTSTKVCSLDNIKLFKVVDIDFQNNKRSEDSQTDSRSRKRRKYEKVSKTHFFDFGTPSQTQDISQSVLPTDTKDSGITPQIESDVAEEKELVVKDTEPAQVDDSHDSPKEEEAIDKDDKDNKDDKGNDIKDNDNKENNEPLDKEKKRSGDEDIKQRPKKIGKFMPKVSLVDAIKSTREKAEQSIKEELGIVEDGNDEVTKDLSNLVIVETIEIKLRERNPPTDFESNVKRDYNGRKNFKKFKKNQKLKSNVTRSFVELTSIAANKELSLNITNHTLPEDAEEALGKDFDKYMETVKTMTPGKTLPFGLTDASDDDNDSFSFQSDKSRSKPAQSSLFVDEESQSQSVPVVSKAKTRTKAKAQAPIYYDDDDDDDDDQPKFGFSRAS